MTNEEQQAEDKVLRNKELPATQAEPSETTKELWAERKKDFLKEIDLILAVVTRMANTSFLIKGWTVTMMTFIFATKCEPKALPLVFVPILLFWVLDAYFLQQERLYRKLYQWVVENRMLSEKHLFSLSTARVQDQNKPIIRIMFSTTLGVFYGGALLLVIIYISYITYFNS
jgi:hypothetical protein